MRAKLAAVLVIAMMSVGVGCAAILSSGPDPMGFVSDPDGAEVLVNGQLMGRTPLQLQLHPDKRYTVTFRKDGYRDAVVTLQTHVQAGWVIADIFLTGLIGVVIDAATGEWIPSVRAASAQ
jgi:hypothetical protein